MTAQVLVMNRWAVALAADSAVSIEYGNRTKTYTRAKKLFRLTRKPSVALMVYDSSEYLGLPWEVICGEFYGRHGNDEPTTVDDCVQEFFNFVGTSLGRWAAPSDVQAAVMQSTRLFAADLGERWSKRLETMPTGSSEDDTQRAAQELTEDYIARRSSFLNRQPQVVDEDGRHNEGIYDPVVEATINEQVPGLWSNLSSSVKTNLVHLGRESCRHISNKESGKTGLLFAGFGTRELFPRAEAYTVSGCFDSHGDRDDPVYRRMVRRQHRGSWILSNEKRGLIMPVGQTAVARSFINGIHPDVRQAVSDMLNAVSEPAGGRADEYRKALEVAFQERESELLEPLMEAVFFLPSADLAKLARSLISMTALRNRVTMSPETVGEPLDVALVTASEGFTWLERSDGRSSDSREPMR